MIILLEQIIGTEGYLQISAENVPGMDIVLESREMMKYKMFWSGAKLPSLKEWMTGWDTG